MPLPDISRSHGRMARAADAKHEGLIPVDKVQQTIHASAPRLEKCLANFEVAFGVFQREAERGGFLRQPCQNLVVGVEPGQGASWRTLMQPAVNASVILFRLWQLANKKRHRSESPNSRRSWDE